MIKLLADASLPKLAEFFPAPFQLSVYDDLSTVSSLISDHDVLLCRSTLKLNNNTLPSHHKLSIIATASSGVDHIDRLLLAQHSIQLIDAKGSNANSVADYVVSSLAFLQKNKGLNGNKVGIIGYGAVGSTVGAYLSCLKFDVCHYDPFKPIQSDALADILACDVICIHANLHDTAPYASRNLLAANELRQLKPKTIIINASRGSIVSEEALLALKPPIFYNTDVFYDEPMINPAIVDFATLCTPHIAGHNLEAKIAAVMMVSQKIHDYYQLPQPDYPCLVPDALPKFHHSSWPDDVLSLYNPIDETNALKKADNKQTAFQLLRQAHKNRHDFRNTLMLPKQTDE